MKTSFLFAILAILLSGEIFSQTIQIYQKTYTAGAGEIGTYTSPTSDGGLIVAGYTTSGGADALIVKLDKNGTVEWSKTYGTNGTQVAYAVKQATDGGFIVVASNDPLDNFIRDILLLKLKSNGDIDWSKTYGTADNDIGYDLTLATDGGYIVVGETAKTFSSIVGGSLIFKVNADGDVSWYKQLGSANGNILFSVTKTLDGKYIAAGAINNGYINYIKFSQDGTINWSKSSLGTGVLGAAYANQIIATSDGGYVIAGNFGGAGVSDAAIVKLSSDGEVDWWNRIGKASDGAVEDRAFGIQEYGENYIVSGYSNNGGHKCITFSIASDGSIASAGTISSAERYGMILGQGGDGGVAFATQKDGQMLVIKMDNDGYSGCENTAADLSILGDTYLTGDTPFSPAGSSSASDLTLSEADITLIESTSCTDVPVYELYESDLVTIYPNPAKNSILIDLNNTTNDSPGLISIVDVNGQLISTTKFGNMKTMSIDISDLSAGLYFLNVSYNNKFIRKKLVVSQ